MSNNYPPGITGCEPEITGFCQEDTVEKRIGKACKAARKRLGMSQKFLARELGISHTYYFRVEKGIQTPSLSLMVKMAKVLSLSLDETLK